MDAERRGRFRMLQLAVMRVLAMLQGCVSAPARPFQKLPKDKPMSYRQINYDKHVVSYGYIAKPFEVNVRNMLPAKWKHIFNPAATGPRPSRTTGAIPVPRRDHEAIEVTACTAVFGGVFELF